MTIPIVWFGLLLLILPVLSVEVPENSENLWLSLKKCNAELLYSEIRFSAFINSLPPFVKHASRMLNDDRFVDLYLRSGDNVYPAHRIILAGMSFRGFLLRGFQVDHFDCVSYCESLVQFETKAILSFWYLSHKSGFLFINL